MVDTLFLCQLDGEVRRGREIELEAKFDVVRQICSAAADWVVEAKVVGATWTGVATVVDVEVTKEEVD